MLTTMSTDQFDSHSRAHDTGPNWGRLLYWPMSSVLMFYMVVLSLICVDEFFLDHRLILEPMRTYTPDLIEPLCGLCLAVYWPLTHIMHALQIAPG